MTLADKKILITGGTGSFGKAFVKTVFAFYPDVKRLAVLSRDELKQFEMAQDFAPSDYPAIRYFIGDIRERDRLRRALEGIEIVIHAAALKQVPACEYFPTQAVMTNCMGASNIVQAIRENGYPVESVVAISTDKACKPVNVMGMTKSIQERIITTANILNPSTRFICVRYGNVLASRGSVIPLFLDQIKNGGPLTVTVAGMTRFLLSLDQAVDTVFEALKEAEPGETFIPRAPSATVMNIARALSGDRPIEIVATGIRPGEKMHEILVSEEEANHCIARGDYYAILSMLPELSNNKKQLPNALTKEYSSADSVLDLDGTIELLKKHRLRVEDLEDSKSGELLR